MMGCDKNTCLCSNKGCKNHGGCVFFTSKVYFISCAYNEYVRLNLTQNNDYFVQIFWQYWELVLKLLLVQTQPR